jgi:hypothetical protein
MGGPDGVLVPRGPRGWQVYLDEDAGHAQARNGEMRIQDPREGPFGGSSR